MARDQGQRATLAGAADVDRRVRLLEGSGETGGGVELEVASREGRRCLGEEQLQDLERLVEAFGTHALGWKLDAELRVLGRVRAAPDPEVEAPAARVVERDRHLRQQGRVAEAVGEHEMTQPDALGARRQGGRRRPRLEPGQRRHPRSGRGGP